MSVGRGPHGVNVNEGVELIMFTAVLHHDGEYDGLARTGHAAREAADRLAETLTGYTGVPYRSAGYITGGPTIVRARFAPNIDHRITISEGDD